MPPAAPFVTTGSRRSCPDACAVLVLWPGHFSSSEPALETHHAHSLGEPSCSPSSSGAQTSLSPVAAQHRCSFSGD